MATVKIISNPYKKEICYRKWSDEKQDWTNIDASTAKNSKLLDDELSHGLRHFVFYSIESNPFTNVPVVD